MTSEILLVTTTFYPEPLDKKSVRRDLAFQMAMNAHSLAVPLLVLDGSPFEETRNVFRAYGAHVFCQQTKGMGPSRREMTFQAVELCKAKGIKAIVWTEAEKVGYVQYAEETARPIINGDADMVLACRTEESRTSCPQFQVESEVHLNMAIAKALGIEAVKDFLGPIAFSVDSAMKYMLLQYPKDHGVEDKYIQLSAPIIGQRHGARVAVSRPFNVIYPQDQREEEAGSLRAVMVKKRDDQLRGISHACEVFASLPPI